MSLEFVAYNFFNEFVKYIKKYDGAKDYGGVIRRFIRFWNDNRNGFSQCVG